MKSHRFIIFILVCGVLLLLVSGVVSAGDYDDDGTDDTSDNDDDDDGVGDNDDDCPKGKLSWSSTLTVDWDGDGCHDVDEDYDDDNDGVNDIIDSCPKGVQGNNWMWTDWDDDGCHNDEDDDDDNDGVLDGGDSCSEDYSKQNWNSDSSSDYDGDGCHNDEDYDDDNDGKSDGNDDCSLGKLNWISTDNNDLDDDGCHDIDEDNYVDCYWRDQDENTICSNYEAIDEELVWLTIGWSVTIFIVVGLGVMFVRKRKSRNKGGESNRALLHSQTIVPSAQPSSSMTGFISPRESVLAPPPVETPQLSIGVPNANTQSQMMSCARCQNQISVGNQKHCTWCGTPYHPPCSNSPFQCLVCGGSF